MELCFVILHYRTSEDTIECVRSIQELDGKYNIVIVDNASQNGSIEKVESIFSSDNKIFIIKNQKNLGFAEGNNIGYDYARKQLHATMVAVLNNDIVIKQKNFISKVFQLYRKSNFYVASPDIISLVDNHHQNPVTEKIVSKSKVTKEIFRYRILRIFNKIGLYDILRKRSSNESNNSVKKEAQEYQENIMLHGSFIILSPLFVIKEEKAFRPGTFLYMEEPILYKYCMLKNYKTVFDPSLVVYHKEDSSTNSLHSAAKAKREFVFKNMIKSLKVYRDLIK